MVGLELEARVGIEPISNHLFSLDIFCCSEAVTHKLTHRAKLAVNSFSVSNFLNRIGMCLNRLHVKPALSETSWHLLKLLDIITVGAK